MEIPSPNTVDEVFEDFKGRRLAFIKALTTDVDEFFEKCDPESAHLCLYGLPNGSWEVTLPVEEVPSELPEPALGINFARDGMRDKDWLSFVAAHSDSWLLSVAFYFGVRFGFDKSERMRIFEKINDLPTVYDVVSGNAMPSKDQSGNNNSSTSKSSGTTEQPKAVEKEEEESEEEGEDEQGGTLCGACGGGYASHEFWICCDLCEKWFHGECVKITPAKAEQIKQYKCPFCNNKKKVKV